MRQVGSLSHSRWECKYHVVFIPKYRKKSIFGGDRTYKLGSGTTSGYGRYVKSLGEPRGGAALTTEPALVGTSDVEPRTVPLGMRPPGFSKFPIFEPVNLQAPAVSDFFR